MKFYFVFNFFYMIFIIFKSYKFESFRLIYDTIEQLFRMSIGRLFGLRAIDYNYKPQTQRNFLGKNILDFDTEKSKVFKKKYEEIDFLVLNDYITIEEGNKKTDELLKKEYGYGFLVTLDGHYETVKEKLLKINNPLGFLKSTPLTFKGRGGKNRIIMIWQVNMTKL